MMSCTINDSKTCPTSFHQHQTPTKKKGACFLLRPENHPQGGSWVMNLPKVVSLHANWVYSWGLDGYDVVQQYNKDHPDEAAIEWVPMVWGAWDATKLKESIETANIPSLIEDGAVSMFLAFNEPDQKDQSNMTVENAIRYWSVLQEVLPSRVKLVSPACARPGGPWMKEFMTQASASIRNFQLDYIAVHWYGGTNFTAFCTQMLQYYNQYNHIPLLVTEFACADWNAKTPSQNRMKPEAVLSFMKQALPWLERTQWIIGYAWFSFSVTSPVGCTSALFEEDRTDHPAQLTTLGRFYQSVSTENPDGDQSITL